MRVGGLTGMIILEFAEARESILQSHKAKMTQLRWNVIHRMQKTISPLMISADRLLFFGYKFGIRM